MKGKNMISTLKQNKRNHTNSTSCDHSNISYFSDNKYLCGTSEKMDL